MNKHVPAQHFLLVAIIAHSSLARTNGRNKPSNIVEILDLMHTGSDEPCPTKSRVSFCSGYRKKFHGIYMDHSTVITAVEVIFSLLEQVIYVEMKTNRKLLNFEHLMQEIHLEAFFGTVKRRKAILRPNPISFVHVAHLKREVWILYFQESERNMLDM